MPTCKTPLWMLQQLQDIVDESDLGRKGLAGRLGVSEALMGYWLTGREQFPLLRFRQAAEALGLEHGRRLLEILAGDGFLVCPNAAAAELRELERLGARSMAAEGRLIDQLCDALKDGEISCLEADVLVREANDVASLVGAIKAAIRAKAKKGASR